METKQDLLNKDDLETFQMQVKLLQQQRVGETKGERSPGRVESWHQGTIMNDVLDIKAKHLLQKKKSPTNSPKSWGKAKAEVVQQTVKVSSFGKEQIKTARSDEGKVGVLQLKNFHFI